VKPQPKTIPDEDLHMGTDEFDEAMRKAFGVPPPPPKCKAKSVPVRGTKERPKSPRRK
jgi:hypothetical protein